METTENLKTKFNLGDLISNDEAPESTSITQPVVKEEKSTEVENSMPAPKAEPVSEPQQTNDENNKYVIDEDSINQLLAEVSKENNPEMYVYEWVGNTNLLLDYIINIQNKANLTIPLEALGVDTQMFDLVNLDKNQIQVDDKYYELICVDGKHYLSCLSCASDVEHFKSLILDITSKLNEFGSYTLYRSCLRVFDIKNEEDNPISDINTRSFVYCLNLNSFELQAIKTYLSKVGSVTITAKKNEEGREILLLEDKQF